jgi:APA family basic amino acid/polyamine antiporter
MMRTKDDNIAAPSEALPDTNTTEPGKTGSDGPNVPPAQTSGTARLARKLGLFDATMIVMGGSIGSGIFMNPHVVALQVHTPILILGAWVIGGVVALMGAFIYAELAALRPYVGGQYAYFRDAYNPAVAFLYGWMLLLVIQTGGMAAVAITFATYFEQLTHTGLPEVATAAVALAILTAINCLGVRAGSTVQSILMLLKIGAIAALVICGLIFAGVAHPEAAHTGTAGVGLVGQALPGDAQSAHPFSFTAMGAALVPVLFAYGGWQTSSFVAGELRNPRKDLPRGLMIGVLGVILLYTAVNFVCIRALGPAGLAETKTPASAVMMAALGKPGATFIAIGITISTLGFLSQSILTAPRVYYAMAEDGLFFRRVAWLDPRSHVPTVAIVLQGIFAIVIALSGKYEQILNYVVSADFTFFGLAAASIFVFRRRGAPSLARDDFGAGADAYSATNPAGPSGSDPLPSASQTNSAADKVGYRIPGHPITTLIFIAVCWLVVINTIYRYPINTGIGIGILLAGVPVYIFWRRRGRH